MQMMDYILLGVVAAWITATILFLRKKKKNGSCLGCHCDSCNKCPKK